MLLDIGAAITLMVVRLFNFQNNVPNDKLLNLSLTGLSGIEHGDKNAEYFLIVPYLRAGMTMSMISMKLYWPSFLEIYPHY